MHTSAPSALGSRRVCPARAGLRVQLTTGSRRQRLPTRRVGWKAQLNTEGLRDRRAEWALPKLRALRVPAQGAGPGQGLGCRLPRQVRGWDFCCPGGLGGADGRRGHGRGGAAGRTRDRDLGGKGTQQGTLPGGQLQRRNTQRPLAVGMLPSRPPGTTAQKPLWARLLQQPKSRPCPNRAVQLQGREGPAPHQGRRSPQHQSRLRSRGLTAGPH